MKRETVLKHAPTLVAAIARNVPLAGIFAFALASVWSLFQMFNDNALHPTPLYWIPAGLVEVVTAWLVYQAVESLRIVTDTKSPKRDRRFHVIIAGICIVLATPTLAVSYTANRYEFQGDAGLASLFPISCVACAVASAIPHVKVRKADSRLAKEREAHAATRAKLREALAMRELVEPTRADFDEIRAKLNGKNTPQQVNVALVQAGFLPISEGTIRSRLQ